MMESQHSALRIASYNVKGVLNPIKRSKILGKMKKMNILNLVDRALTRYIHHHIKLDTDEGLLHLYRKR